MVFFRTYVIERRFPSFGKDKGSFIRIYESVRFDAAAQEIGEKKNLSSTENAIKNLFFKKLSTL